MERFVIIVNGFKLLTIITKRSILDLAAALDPPLDLFFSSYRGKWRMEEYNESQTDFRVNYKP